MEKDFLNVLRKIGEITGEDPCKKKMQKLVYLIENSKGKLGYEYGIHFYGPYSAQLDAEIHSLYYEGKIKVDYKGMAHCLSVKESTPIYPNENNRDVDDILEKYAPYSPNDLERITTTLYIMQNIDCKDDEEIIQKVVDIKGSKYKREEIREAIRMLREDSLLILRREADCEPLGR